MTTYKPILSTTPPTSGNSKQLYSPELFDIYTGTYPILPAPSGVTYAKNISGQFQFFEGFEPDETSVGSFIASNADQLLFNSTASWPTVDTDTHPSHLHYENSIVALRANRVALEAAKLATCLISMEARLYSRDTTYSGPPGVDYHYLEATPIDTTPSDTVSIAGHHYTISSLLWTEQTPLTDTHVTATVWDGPPPGGAVWLTSDVIVNQVVALQLVPVGAAPLDLTTILSPGDTVSFVIP